MLTIGMINFCVVTGGLVGLLIHWLYKGGRYGRVVDSIIGALGALFINTPLWILTPQDMTTVASVDTAFIGAVVLTAIARRIR